MYMHFIATAKVHRRYFENIMIILQYLSKMVLPIPQYFLNIPKIGSHKKILLYLDTDMGMDTLTKIKDKTFLLWKSRRRI